MKKLLILLIFYKKDPDGKYKLKNFFFIYLVKGFLTFFCNTDTTELPDF